MLRPARQGSILLVFGGKVVGADAFLAMQARRASSHFVQVARDLWMASAAEHPETGDYINHNCEPNPPARTSPSTTQP